MTADIDPLGLVACALAVWAGAVDLVSGRIPNALTYTALAFAVVAVVALGWAMGGDIGSGLGTALAGGGLLFGIGLALFAAGVLGGGDVKLMAALGVLLGWPQALDMLVLAFVLGGLHAAAVRVAALCRGVASAAEIRFGPAIALAVVATAALPGFQVWGLLR